MLSPTAAQAYWDELEKIAGVGNTLAMGATGAALGSALGLGSTAMYLHGNAMQDQLLRDTGILSGDEAKRRQMNRISAIVGVGAALGLGGAVAGALAPLGVKHVGKTIANMTEEMWSNAGKSLQKGLDQGLEQQVKSGDKLLAKQMEYGRGMVVETAPEVSRAMGREFISGVGESLPLIGRFFRPPPKALTAIKR